MEERDKAKSREAVKETLGKPETELPQSKVDELSQSSGGSEEKSDSQLIELATFPGYSPEHCTPLPHGMSTLDQMRRITRAQKMLATKRGGFRECWRQLLYSPPSQAIFLDYFWWFFLHKYQPHNEVQDKLFSRVAKKYVELLCQPVDERWRDAFFKVYPDVIAQCVYSAYIFAYPNSWNSFDDSFKTDVCRIISLWQVGILPLASCWRKWELSLLEPPNIPKFKPTSDAGDGLPRSPRKGFNLDSLIKAATDSAEPATQKASKSGHSQAKLHLRSSSSSVGSQKSAKTKRISMSELKSTLWSDSSRGQLPVTEIRRGGEATRSHGEATSQLKTIVIEQRKLAVAKRQYANLAQQKHHQHAPSELEAHTKIPRSRSTSVDPPPNYKPNAAQQTSDYSQQKKVPTEQPRPPTNAVSVSSTSSVATSQAASKAGAAAKPQTGEDGKEKDAKHTWKEKAIALTQKRKEAAKVPVQGPQFEHMLFDVHGQSPLVKHYMQRRRLGYDTEYALLMRRTEVVGRQPDTSSSAAAVVTYQEILKESKDQEKKTHQLFQKNYEKQKQLMAQAQKRRKRAAAKHEWDVNKVLFNKKEMRTLSNDLTIQVMTKKGAEKTKAVSAAIEKTLDRVSDK